MLESQKEEVGQVWVTKRFKNDKTIKCNSAVMSSFLRQEIPRLNSCQVHHDDQRTFSIKVKEVEQLNPHSKNYTLFRTITLKMNYTQENNIFVVFVINFIIIIYIIIVFFYLNFVT